MAYFAGVTERPLRKPVPAMDTTAQIDQPGACAQFECAGTRVQWISENT